MRLRSPCNAGCPLLKTLRRGFFVLLLNAAAFGLQAAPGQLGFTTNVQATVREDTGGVWIVVERLDGADGVVNVQYTTVGLTAVAGLDFDPVSGLLEFQDGETNQSLLVPIVNDMDIEATEIFSVRLSNPGNGATLTPNRSQTFVPVEDDDDPGAIEISAGAFSETDGVAEIVVTRVRAFNGTASVDVGTEDGTALAGEDYVATNLTLVFGAGRIEQTLQIALIDDSLVETNEEFVVRLGNPSPGASIIVETAAVVLLSEDLPQEVGFATNLFRVAEADGRVRIDVQRFHGSTGTVTVHYATGGGSGYEPAAGTLAFPEGNTLQSFFVPIVDDYFPETRHFSVFLSNLAGDAILSASARMATVAIVDDDTVASYTNATFQVTSETASEAGGFVRIVVDRMRPPVGPVSVELTTRDGTALAGMDYVSTNLTVSFEDGESRRVLLVPLIDDSAHEVPEAFYVDLSNPSSESGIAIGTAALSLVDDDPAVRFAGDRYLVMESEGSILLPVIRESTLGETTVNYQTRIVSAEAGLDYDTAEGSLTFIEGESGTDVEVTILQDEIVEGAEEFDVFLTDPDQPGVVLDRLTVEIVADPSWPESCTREGVTSVVASGGEHQFLCDALVVLTETLVVSNAVRLDGMGHGVTLSGRGELRLFEVRPEGSLTLIGINLVEGGGIGGGAIRNEGELILLGCNVWSNRVAGSVGRAGFWGARGLRGLGGLHSGVSGFYTDGAPGGAGDAGGSASGGAVLNLGSLWATNCTLRGNSATGGHGGGGGSGGPGGVIVDDFGRTYGTAAGGVGGVGGVGGEALGGALCNMGSAALCAIVFADNQVLAGAGGAGSRGGGGGSLFAGYTQALDGDGGLGGRAAGGAIFNSGILALERVSLVLNGASGGIGGAGVPRLLDIGSSGGAGGPAGGGALWNEGSVTLVNTTAGENRARAGRGGQGAAGPDASGFYIGLVKAGDGGNGSGGAIFNDGTLGAVNCTISDNLAEGGRPGGIETTLPQIAPGLVGVSGAGHGDSLVNEDRCELVNTILGGTGPNTIVSGPVIDQGHNICSDASAGFTAASSANSTDPRLLPLRNHGSHALVFSLGSSSPALDAGDDNACPPVDQLGLPRPAGARCDIGAVEQTFLRLATRKDGRFQLSYRTLPGTRCHLESSGNLDSWEAVEEVVADLGGSVIFTPITPGSRVSFRVRLEESH